MRKISIVVTVASTLTHIAAGNYMKTSAALFWMVATWVLTWGLDAAVGLWLAQYLIVGVASALLLVVVDRLLARRRLTTDTLVGEVSRSGGRT